MSHRPQVAIPADDPRSIYTSYITNCSRTYDTLTAAEKKVFKFAVRENHEFRTLLIEWEKQHDAESSEAGGHIQEARRLKLALRHIIDDNKLPLDDTLLLESDGHPSTADARPAQAASAQPAATRKPGLYGRLGIGSRAPQVAPNASGGTGPSRMSPFKSRAYRTVAATTQDQTPALNRLPQIGRASAADQEIDRRIRGPRGDARNLGGGAGGCCSIS